MMFSFRLIKHSKLFIFKTRRCLGHITSFKRCFNVDKTFCRYDDVVSTLKRCRVSCTGMCVILCNMKSFDLCIKGLIKMVHNSLAYFCEGKRIQKNGAIRTIIPRFFTTLSGNVRPTMIARER